MTTTENKTPETESGRTDGDASSPLGLVDVLDALGRDLATARDRFADDPTQTSHYGLGVTEAVVELSVAVTREKGREGSAGVKWHVLALGGERTSKDDDNRVQRITLTLKPVDTDSPVGDPALLTRPFRPVGVKPVTVRETPTPVVGKRPGKAEKI